MLVIGLRSWRSGRGSEKMHFSVGYTTVVVNEERAYVSQEGDEHGPSRIGVVP